MSLLLFLVIVLLLFHLAWYVFSFYKTHHAVPDETIIEQFRADNQDMLNLKAVMGLLEENSLEANGVRLHLDILANGRGLPTVVFIPGTSVYAQTYMNFLHALSMTGFNVVAFDPRGHGRSSGPRGDYTIGEIAADALAVAAYARQRFGGKVALVGSSQGGIAAFYAAAQDDSLAAAVCHNLADLNGRENQVLSKIRVPYWMTPLAQLTMGIYRRFVIPIALYLDLKEEYLENGLSAADYIQQDPLCVTWITWRALNSLLKTPLAKPVEAIKVPIMVVHSGKDHIFPQSYVEEIYQRLTCRKHFLLLKNREHLVMINRVQEVTPEIAAWLQEMVEPTA
ncbi:MAG: alpha/beta fold hydrolase [Desulfobacteraceae bacterium]|nr:alpha/beta fold hydrolase [Desulfobacteraceae bacterium]